MKISEMNEDQLRDYALKLEEENQAFIEREKGLNEEIGELTDLNKQLQKRNNDLFMKVEQQGTAGDPNDYKNPPEPEKTETCEEFAKRLIEGGNK